MFASPRAGAARPGLVSALVRVGVLVTPTLLFGVAVSRESGETARALAVGVGLQLVLLVILMAWSRRWMPPLGPAVLTGYWTGLGWLHVSVPADSMDWYLHLLRAILALAPLGVVAEHVLIHSGALLFRRARTLAEQIRRRTKWPRDLDACRDLPEVKDFRQSLQFDASPALGLLDHKRDEVRLCALLALEFRRHWRTGQPEMVLSLLNHEAVPEVRAAAVNALGNIDERHIVEAVASYLRDPSPKVRKAAASALFWNSDHRWWWMRLGVRLALADPALREDGALLPEGRTLPREAVADLTAWAAEKGVLSLRSAETLAVHYARTLVEELEDTRSRIVRTVEDPHAPPLLRIELARLLHEQKLGEAKLWEGLLDAGNPAPLRLQGAEGLLVVGPHVRAIATLREVARLPNRELALATGQVVQRCLGVDLGLPLGQALPALNSSKAIDVVRRLMAWAANPDHVENVLDTAFPASKSRLAIGWDG
jgi:hypothetical protein